jgi:hypothetical protein
MDYKTISFACLAATWCVACSRPVSRATGIITIPADSGFQVVSSERALSSFKPAREPVLEGGECVNSEVRTAGVRQLIVHFPNRKDPETAIVVFVDSSGKVIRYIENRGVPRPSKSLDEMQTQMRELVRTYIQVDYVIDEATISNSGPAQKPYVVRGSVKQLENAQTVGDLRTRAALVRQICERKTGALE